MAEYDVNVTTEYKDEGEKYDRKIFIHTRNLFEDFTKEDFEKYPDKFKFGDIRIKVLKEDMAYKPIEVVTEYLDKNKIKYEHEESGGLRMLRKKKSRVWLLF
jgi:peptide methionine sulfoxide reductase MsrA